ncbi:50S ribosomal protein L4 [Candidatus Woesearchaeota archaeon]|jgi:large subunit ribosomal protein L4e|nr:50S ribosomal protein L4 [Candidatus Woesearchaeota archaeon]
MKINIVDKKGKEKGNITLAGYFNEPLRQDLIKRAVLSLQSRKRQPYGSDPEAGKRHSTLISKRRRKYRGCYGHGISRVPRKILSRRGTRMFWVGAFAPGTVGGRRAHPPKAEKIWEQNINKKENKKAFLSALSATLNKKLAEQRNHMLPEKYPFIITDDFEKLSKTKEIISALQSLGFEKELERTKYRKIRAGKGKSRGRKYKKSKSLLIVVSSKDSLLKKHGKNIPGVDITDALSLNTEDLAPGAVPGRATLYTESSIKVLDERITGKK